MAFTVKPIGRIYTPYKEKHGVPIQGIFDPDSKGRVVVLKEFEPGLRDIEGFSHLILLYLFDRSEGYDLVCKPYLEDKEHGVFATRAPKRPNPIGLSVVRLERREGPVLYITEVDILDDTPLLDIKPFIPDIDHRESARVGWLEGLLEKSNPRTVSDDRF
jgi:tRNA-Thr(GGU) m(6)t(6)A37 methyltransferase TsaA